MARTATEYEYTSLINIVILYKLKVIILIHTVSCKDIWKINNEGKNNVLSANKQSNELHTAVLVAFSYLLQSRVKTGGELLLQFFSGSNRRWSSLGIGQ